MQPRREEQRAEPAAPPRRRRADAAVRSRGRLPDAAARARSARSARSRSASICSRSRSSRRLSRSNASFRAATTTPARRVSRWPSAPPAGAPSCSLAGRSPGAPAASRARSLTPTTASRMRSQGRGILRTLRAQLRRANRVIAFRAQPAFAERPLRRRQAAAGRSTGTTSRCGSSASVTSPSSRRRCDRRTRPRRDRPACAAARTALDVV